MTEDIKPQKVTNTSKGVYVFDLGQNMVGWARLKVSGPTGTRVRMRFAERLKPDGSIYTENLRNADASDTYVLRGGGAQLPGRLEGDALGGLAAAGLALVGDDVGGVRGHDRLPQPSSEPAAGSSWAEPVDGGFW